MRAFFVALGVRLQGVAGPLPREAQLAQPAADGPLGRGAAAVPGQVLVQQPDGPLDRRVAQRVGPAGQRLTQGGLPVLGPDGGVIPAPAVAQAAGGPLGLVAAQPVVDAHPAGAQQAGDLGDGPAGGHLQEGQRAAEEESVSGRPQLLLQGSPLAFGQSQPAHGTPQPGAYRFTGRV